jgi:hypothetical protein
VVAGDAASEVDGASSVIRASSHNKHDTGSMEMDDPQGAGQVAPVVNISVFGEAHLSIAGCSPETSASSLRENDPAMADISTFTTTKILDKRSTPCGVAHGCELEPLWSV